MKAPGEDETQKQGAMGMVLTECDTGRALTVLKKPHKPKKLVVTVE